jgi:hypothetical protein
LAVNRFSLRSFRRFTPCTWFTLRPYRYTLLAVEYLGNCSQNDTNQLVVALRRDVPRYLTERKPIEDLGICPASASALTGAPNVGGCPMRFTAPIEFTRADALFAATDLTVRRNEEGAVKEFSNELNLHRVNALISGNRRTAPDQ